MIGVLPTLKITFTPLKMGWLEDNTVCFLGEGPSFSGAFAVNVKECLSQMNHLGTRKTLRKRVPPIRMGKLELEPPSRHLFNYPVILRILGPKNFSFKCKCIIPGSLAPPISQGRPFFTTPQSAKFEVWVSSVHNLFGCFIRDPFRGYLVTSSWTSVNLFIPWFWTGWTLRYCAFYVSLLGRVCAIFLLFVKRGNFVKYEMWFVRAIDNVY